MSTAAQGTQRRLKATGLAALLVLVAWSWGCADTEMPDATAASLVFTEDVTVSSGEGAPSTSPATDTEATTTTLLRGSGPTASYTDADFGFTLQYPEDWTLTDGVATESNAGSEAAKSIGIFDPEGAQTETLLLEGVVVSAFPLNTVVAEALMPAFRQEVENVLGDIERQLADEKSLEPLHALVINGLHGYVAAYAFSQENRRMRTRLVFLVDRDVEYELALQAEASAWEAKEPELNVILGSFRTVR